MEENEKTIQLSVEGDSGDEALVFRDPENNVKYVIKVKDLRRAMARAEGYDRGY